MKKIIVALLITVLSLTGCGSTDVVEGEEIIEVEEATTDDTLNNENPVSHIDVVRKMFEDDASKVEIDTYVLAHISEIDEKYVDEIVYKLMKRIDDYVNQTIGTLIKEDVQTKLRDVYNKDSNTFDLNKLTKNMDFINKAYDYGSHLHRAGVYVLLTTDNDIFSQYDEYISKEMKMYVNIMLNSAIYYGETEENIKYYQNLASTAKQIDSLLLINSRDLIKESDFKSTMHYINEILAYSGPNSIQDLSESYKSKRKMNAAVIELYEVLINNYSDVYGLENTINYINVLKENDYILNDETYDYIKNIDSTSREVDFIKKYNNKIEELRSSININEIEITDLKQHNDN